MRKRIFACTVLFCLIVPSAKLVSQTQQAATAPGAAGPPTSPASSATSSAAALPDPKTPSEFFARARQLSDLEAAGIPFHLKATYVASGDTEFTGNGTYEEWWQSKDLWRKEATLGDYKYVEIQSGGKHSIYGSSDYVPLRLRQTLDSVPVQIDPDTSSASKWKLKQKKLKGVDLAVLSGESEYGDGKYKAKCAAEDYFTQEGVLRIRLRGSVEDVYNEFQPFQGRLIPRNIGVAGGEGGILTISIGSLELLNSGGTALLKNAPPPTNLRPFPAAVDMRNKAAPSEPTFKAQASKIIHIVQPIYPADVKHGGIEGTVVLDVMIDETGKVREPFVVYSAGAMLDKSALDAVRQWRYSPTMLNGSPVCVSTRISVVFRLNH